MTTLEIGNQLVALCKQGKNHQAIETLYAPDVVSVTTTPSSCGIGFGPKLWSDWVCGSPPYQTPSCEVSP